jgi:hypothetical protein
MTTESNVLSIKRGKFEIFNFKKVNSKDLGDKLTTNLETALVRRTAVCF